MPVSASVIKSADARRTETPNAVMTTLASPTQGSAARPLWRVDMRAGQQGPVHVMDSEQVWAVLAGGASVEVDGQAVTLEAGDTIVLPTGACRQVAASDSGLVAVVAGAPRARASLADGTDRGVPPWTQ